MSRVTPYEKTTWVNSPSRTSPVDAANLNHIEQGIKAVTDAVNEIEVDIEPATTNTLGGIKVGSNLSITQDGTLSADAQQYTLPTASEDTKGGVKVRFLTNGLYMDGAYLKLASAGSDQKGGIIPRTGLTVNSNGYADVKAATTSSLGGIIVGSGLSVTEYGVLSADAQQYTLPAATTSTLGGIKVGSGLSIEQDGTLSATGGAITYATSAEIIALFNDGTDVYLDGESPSVTF